jgi:hypothetical protein
MECVDIVDRNADVEAGVAVVSDCEDAWEEDRVPDLPFITVLALPFEKPPL